jgi:hypothetical protein
MKTYFFGPIYTGNIIKNVIERTYIGDGNKTFTSSNIGISGLVKEVKHYEPAFQELSNAVSDLNIITFPSAINSKISVGDEVFGTNLDTNPTITTIATNREQITVSAAVNMTDASNKLLFVGSVDADDTFVVAENVSFYDDGVKDDYSEEDNS